MRDAARALGSNRRLAWPAKPPFLARVSMSGTGPPVFTASGGPTPFFQACFESGARPDTGAPPPPLAGEGRGEGLSALGLPMAFAPVGRDRPVLHGSSFPQGKKRCRVRGTPIRLTKRVNPAIRTSFPERSCREAGGSGRNRQRIFPFRALSGPPSSPINAPNHRGPAPYLAPSGEVAEWLNAPHSKCGIGASLSGVRIPPSPP